MVTGNELTGARKDASSNPVSNIPTSLRLATEAMLEREHAERDTEREALKQTGTDSIYGVRSLKDSVYDGSSASITKNHYENDQEESSDSRRRSTIRPARSVAESLNEDTLQTPQKPYVESAFMFPGPRHSTQHSPSHSVTSLSVGSQAPLSSVSSSPKSISTRSLRPSDEDSMDEGGSQAVISSSDEDGHLPIEDSAPQLIMPSIKMPSRRPFTDRGKMVGRLKILLAGNTGVGKTSLIKSMVQTCEDIVHVDPTLAKPPASQNLRTSKAKKEFHIPSPTREITEIHASTKPFPSWWSDVEESRPLRRRKSLEDTVLDRNICFVDTPGYSQGLSKMQGIETVLGYIEAQLEKSFSDLSDGESNLVRLLSGNGGSQVDLVLYLISQDFKHEDLLFMERLSKMTNIVPLISRSDTLSMESFESLRRSIHNQLKQASITTFVPSADGTAQSVYSVCSVSSDDAEIMDASLLMSSDFVQPLQPSELGILMDCIFEQNTISRLRHLASKKLLQARHSGTLKLLGGNSRLPLLSPHIDAKIMNHIQQEEKLAQIKLAKWASDLQRGLQSERAQLEAIAKNERTGWLTERLGKCVIEDREILPSTVLASKNKTRRPPRDASAIIHQGSAYQSQASILDAGDPLGILRWNEAMRDRGWVAFQVAGSFSVLGAVVVWAAKTWGIGCTCTSNDDERWIWSLLTGGRQ